VSPAPTGSAGSASRRGRWTTRRSIVAHGALAVWVPGCSVATWWQIGIAESGDALGWVYAVMWPCFALFGVVFWWFLVHDDPDTLGRRGLRRTAGAGPGAGIGTGTGPDAHATSERIRAAQAARAEALARAEAEDPELAAYNAYLGALADRDRTEGDH
jgi:hypothetical protein